MQNTTGDEIDRANGEGTRTDRIVDKAGKRFLKLARKFPEDAHIGSLVGRRYEVRVTRLGGRGLAQINQRQDTIKVTKSASEAQRLADQHGGAVWDRQIGYLIYEAGDRRPAEKKRKRARRDGGVWWTPGSSSQTDDDGEDDE